MKSVTYYFKSIHIFLFSSIYRVCMLKVPFIFMKKGVLTSFVDILKKAE